MIDLIIVGAGAAGIAAAREATRRGVSYVILEASDRVGGRAHHVAWEGHALDLGAGWLHSANRNPLVSLAEQLGFEIDRAPTPWRGQYHGLGFSRHDQAAAFAAFSAFEAQIVKPTAGDVAADALPPGGEWNAFVDALSGYLNGTSLRNMSAADYAAYSSASTECNWRMPRSYGALIARLAEGLKIECGVVVTGIEWDGGHVRLSADRGSFVAQRAIVTVSTAVLARGTIQFMPGLDRHLDAATQLPLGHVEKMFFALDDSEEFPNDAHLIGDPRRADTGSYMLRPMSLPVVEGFFGGDWVARASADDLETFARDELGKLLGSGFGSRIRRIAHSGWKDDPRIGGSYSYARPGQHGCRQTLAEPASDRLAFAGEACSTSDFSTVHGAWESGLAAFQLLFGADDAD